MKTQLTLGAMALSVMGTIGVLSGCSTHKVLAQEPAKTNRGEIDLTVYNQDFAMVCESRDVSLASGRNKLQVADVSKELDPSSVLFSWPKPDTAQVVANIYDLGVQTGQGLLKRYVGQPVEMVWYGQDGKEGTRASGTLQVAGEGGTVMESDGKFMVDPTGTVIAPTRPDIVTIPQLSVDVESPLKQDTNLSVAYLTRGLAWSADYVATLDPDKDSMNMECWATVTNRTGTTFPEAKITLVAGSPNRAALNGNIRGSMGAEYQYSAEKMPASDMSGYGGGVSTLSYNRVAEPASAGELYAYTIKSAATIAPDQMNRVRMIYSNAVPIAKDYSIRLPQGSYDYYTAASPYRQNAQLAINFVNEEKSGLGAPLPEGAVRVYEPDAQGSTRYVGAATLNDTPKAGHISLTLTNVFDVTSEFRLAKTQRIDKRHVRKDYEALLSNAKRTPVTLRVVQGLYGGYKLVSESAKSVKLNAYTLQWKVPIPAGGKKTLAYSVVVGG